MGDSLHYKLLKKLNMTNKKDERQTIYEAASDMAGEFCQEDRIFAALVLCGFPGSRAYRIAYDSKASANSSASLACRKLQDEGVQKIMNRIGRGYWNGNIRLNDRHCREKRKRWPAYLGKRQNKLEP